MNDLNPLNPAQNPVSSGKEPEPGQPHSPLSVRGGAHPLSELLPALGATSVRRERGIIHGALQAVATATNGEFIKDRRGALAAVAIPGPESLLFLAVGELKGRPNVNGTMVSILFQHPSEFRMSITPDDPISRFLDDLFKLKDLFDGNSKFDENFSVFGNDASRVRTILASTEIQRRMCEEPSLAVEFGMMPMTSLPEDLRRGGGILLLEPAITDTQRLMNLIEIARHLAKEVRRTHSANPNTPPAPRPLEDPS